MGRSSKKRKSPAIGKRPKNPQEADIESPAATESANDEPVTRPATRRPFLLKLLIALVVVWMGLLIYLAVRVNS